MFDLEKLTQSVAYLFTQTYTSLKRMCLRGLFKFFLPCEKALRA